MGNLEVELDIVDVKKCEIWKDPITIPIKFLSVEQINKASVSSYNKP